MAKSTSTAITIPHNVEVIPSANIDGVREALERVKEGDLVLTDLSVRARIQVNSTENYQAIGAVLTEVRGVEKQGNAEFFPFEAIVKRVSDFLRSKKNEHKLKCQQIESEILPKMKAWEQQELQETAKEQAKLNKKSDVPVTVKPALPSVAGYRRTTNYRITVVDIPKFLRAAKDRKELRQYIILDEQSLGKEARDMKDCKAFMAKFPGVACVED